MSKKIQLKLIHILTLFPRLFDSFLTTSLLKKAQDNKHISIRVHDIRKFVKDKHKTVDDTPYGGGPGMVLKIEPIYNALNYLKIKQNHTILLTPRGKLFTQKEALRLVTYKTLTFICGRYEGVDERVATHLSHERISIGDFILSGGEVAAMAIIETLTRLIPRVVGKKESVTKFDHQQYTKPQTFRNWSVPKVLVSGNHKKIAAWRKDHKTIWEK